MTKTLAIRLYGKKDLRLEEFELPAMRDDEMLASVTSDSICMSSHKAAIQGTDHKRVPNDAAQNPVIIGHEFCGTILQVGSKWKNKFKPGQKYSIQPAMNIPGREEEAPGYSFRYIGGNSTNIIIPKEVLESDCLLPYDGPGFFPASLSEPVSCIIGAFNSQYHFKQGEYVHKMGIVEGGTMVILAGAGPMGLGAIDYAVHGPKKPNLLVVTDIDQPRLDRAASIFTPENAASHGVTLIYLNTAGADAKEKILAINKGNGYDDVFVFAPVAPLISLASQLLGFNGCLNFFAGPSSKDFCASINFYEIHYSGQHVAGSSGGNTQDMRDALRLMETNSINPAVMITHICGLDNAIQTILDLPSIPGGKKLVYNNISLPLTALTDFKTLGQSNPVFAELARITEKHNGLWSVDAESYLLKNANLHHALA